MRDSSRLENDSRFKARSCPGCGGNSISRLIDIPATRFCVSNSTYSGDFAAILEISPDTAFPIGRCRSCGFAFAELEPNPQFLERVYDQVIGHELNLQANEGANGIARRMRYVADAIQLAPTLVALDFGCGLGTTLRLLEAAGVRSTGYDPSSTRTAHASTRARVVASRDALVRDAPFGIIICDNVLEHLPDPAETVRFLGSLSKPGTVLFASVPDTNAKYFESQRHALAAGGPLDMALNPWEHLNYFDVGQLDRMLARAGFGVVPDAEIHGQAEIGLRRESATTARLKNALASTARLAHYALTGQGTRTSNYAFYRFAR